MIRSKSPKMLQDSPYKLTQDIVKTKTGVFLLRCKCGFITEHKDLNEAANALLDRIVLRQSKMVQSGTE